MCLFKKTDDLNHFFFSRLFSSLFSSTYFLLEILCSWGANFIQINSDWILKGCIKHKFFHANGILTRHSVIINPPSREKYLDNLYVCVQMPTYSRWQREKKTKLKSHHGLSHWIKSTVVLINPNSIQQPSGANSLLFAIIWSILILQEAGSREQEVLPNSKFLQLEVYHSKSATWFFFGLDILSYAHTCMHTYIDKYIQK